MFGAERYAGENARLNRLVAEREILICAHRGAATGMIVENTLQAARAAVLCGATMVELDVIASTDGDHFLFHDGLEPYRLGTLQNINSMSTAQIRSLAYVEQSSTSVSPRVEELAAVLDHFHGRDALLNIDRSWWYWDSLLPFLDRFAMTDQLILKSPVDDDAFTTLAEHGVKYPFMPIVRSGAEIAKACSVRNINLVGLELVAAVPESEVIDPATIADLHNRGLLCLLDAINLEDRVPRCAGFDDERSLFEDPDLGWGELARRGADIIQTDWTALLAAYLNRIGATSPSTPAAGSRAPRVGYR